MSSRRPVCVWLLAFLAYSCLGIAWALAIPANGHTDEHAHVIRAYAVASGQILGPQTTSWNGFSGSDFRVPSNLLPPNDDCLYIPSRQAASCLLPRSGDSSPVLASTWTGRYSPVYYLFAGLPLRFMPDERGLIAARIVTALLAASLLAFAFAVAAKRNMFGVTLGVLLAMTPTMAALSGAVNPNAIEAASAALLFVSLLAVPQDTFLRVLAGLSGAILLTTRTLGPLFFVALLAVAYLASRRRREFLSSLRWPAVAWTLSAIGALTWNQLSGATKFATVPDAFDGSFSFALQSIVDRRFTDWATQLVATFGYTETSVSGIIVIAWWCATVLFASRSAQPRLLTAVAVAIPLLLVALELLYLWRLGFSQNGRYVFPLWIALLLLAGSTFRPSLVLTRAIAGLTAACQIWSLAAVMTRFQSGPGHVLSPLTGQWLPPLGPLIPLGLATLGVTLIAVPIWLTRPSVLPAILKQTSAAGERNAHVSV